MAHYRLGIVCAILAITFYSTFLLAPEFVREIGKCEAVEAGFWAKAWQTIGQVLVSGQQRPDTEFSVGKQWLCSGRNITDSTEQWVRPYVSVTLYHMWCLCLIAFFILIAPELVALVQVAGLIILLPLVWIIRFLVFVYLNYPSIRVVMSQICRSAISYVKNKYSTIKHNGVQFPALSLGTVVDLHDGHRLEGVSSEADTANLGIDRVDMKDGVPETAASVPNIESKQCDFHSVQSHVDVTRDGSVADSRSTLHHCEDIANDSSTEVQGYNIATDSASIQGNIIAIESGSITEEHHDDMPLPSDTIASLTVSVLSELEDPQLEVAVFSRELDLHLDAYLSDSQHSSHVTEPFTSLSTLADSGIEASPFMSITNYDDTMAMCSVPVQARIERNAGNEGVFGASDAGSEIKHAQEETSDIFNPKPEANEMPNGEQEAIEEDYYDQDGTGSWVESRSISSTTIDSASFLEVLGLLTSHAMKEEEASNDTVPLTSDVCTFGLEVTACTQSGNMASIEEGSTTPAEQENNQTRADTNASIDAVLGTVDGADQSEHVSSQTDELSHDRALPDNDAHGPAQDAHPEQRNTDTVNVDAEEDQKLQLPNKEESSDTPSATKQCQRVNQIHLDANCHDLTQEEVRNKQKMKRFLTKHNVAKLVDRFSHFINEHGQADEEMKKSQQQEMDQEKSFGKNGQILDKDSSTPQNPEKAHTARQFWMTHQEQSDETLAQNIQFEKAGCRLESTSSTIGNALMSLFSTPQVAHHEERSQPRQFIDAVESLKKTLATQDSPNVYKSSTLGMESFKPVQFTSALDALGLDKAKLVRPKVIRIQSQFANAIDSLMKSIDMTELHTLQKKRQKRRRAVATKPTGNTTSIDELFYNITNKIEERQQQQKSDIGVKVTENADDCGDSESCFSGLQKAVAEAGIVGKCDDVEPSLKPSSPSRSDNKEEKVEDALSEISKIVKEQSEVRVAEENVTEESGEDIASRRNSLEPEKGTSMPENSDELNSDLKSEKARAVDGPFSCSTRMHHSMKFTKSWRYSTSRPRRSTEVPRTLARTRPGVMSLDETDTESRGILTSTDKRCADEIERNESTEMVYDFSAQRHTGSTHTSMIYLNKTSAERGYYEAASCVSELSCARTIQVDPREMMAMTTVTFSQSEESLMQQPFHYDRNWEERAIEKLMDK